MNATGIALQRRAQPRAAERALVIAEQQESGGAALALHEGVGRQRRGERHQPHLRGGALRQHAGNGCADPLGEIVARRERLCRRQDAARGVVKDGIGIGAAGIDAEGEGQGKNVGTMVG